jgi:rifampicin phosphotransferase
VNISQLVLPLNEVNLPDTTLVGRKAAALGALSAGGFPVPPGICISTDAFRIAFEPFKEKFQSILQNCELTGDQGASEASRQIFTLLTDLHIPEVLAHELDEALAAQPAVSYPLVVRSSAVDEDGEKASFAGQYLTQLGIRDRTQLHHAILACWRSFFNPNALFARANMDLPVISDGMGVIIQPVVPAETAGVCFTLDPVHPAKNQIYVESAWGLGLGVVDGTIASDTAWLSRSSLQLEEKRIVEKPEQITLNPDGGIQKHPVPLEQRSAACLPASWLKRIAEFGIAAEILFGGPQDVEWAIAAGQVWILQSRPITGLEPGLKEAVFPVDWDALRKSGLFWRLVPLSTGNPLLPIEWDYVEAGAKAKEDSGIFSGDEQVIQVAFFNGRPYFTMVPSPLTPGEQRIRQRWLGNLKQRLYEEGKTAWEYWGPEVIQNVEQLGAFDLEGSEDGVLADHLEETFGAIRLHWMIHAQLWPYFWWWLRLSLVEIAHLSEPEAEMAATILLQGEENALTRLVDRLYEIACVARRSARLTSFLKTLHPEATVDLAGLETETNGSEKEVVEAFRRQLEGFLQFYGDRSGKGFGSESTLLRPTWRERPDLVLHMLSPYLDPDMDAPSEARKRAQRGRDAWFEEILTKCSPEQAAELRNQLDQARREGAVLEDHNHYIDQMSSGQARAVVLAAGRRLVKKDSLSNLNDVYWLRLAEVAAELRNPSFSSLSSTVAERKEQHSDWERTYAPPFLGIPGASLEERPSFTSEATEKASAVIPGCIQGQGASPGRRQGRARVIQNNTLLPNLQPGEILVAENAGPLWTPFFPILGGLVLDQGTVGQHAAATAREYGVPAVIGTANATQLISEGDMVVVDGEAGTVEVIQDE